MTTTTVDTTTHNITDDTIKAVSDIPEGFKIRHLGDGFMDLTGPLYYKKKDGGLVLGFRVEKRHCNPMGVCHGGMLATFTDMLLAVSCHTHPNTKNRFLPTVSLQLDYLAGAKLGSWVQGEARVLKATRNLVFLDGLLQANGEPVVRVSGVFKIGPEFSPADFAKLPDIFTGRT